MRSKGERVVHPAAHFAKGEQMGWFEHGSTIVVIAPRDHAPVEVLTQGAHILMGEALMRFDQPPIPPLS